MDAIIRPESLNDYNYYMEMYHTHVASIKQDKKRIKSTRAAYANRIVTKHSSLLTDTLYKPKRSWSVYDSDKQHISKENWPKLQFMNPHRIIPCQEATLRALEAYKIPLKGVSAFTVIEGSHETSDTVFIRDAATLNASENHTLDIHFEGIKNDFQVGLRGFNYIAVMEFAIFEEEEFRDIKRPNDKGWLISPHLQGVIWKDGGITKKDLEDFKPKFSGGRWGATGFDHEPVWDISGSVSYMHKLPLFAYSNTYRHTSKALTQDTAYIMFDRLKYVDFEKIFISGGEGKNIRSVALNYLKEFYQEYKP
jgi:hypothetical protein